VRGIASAAVLRLALLVVVLASLGAPAAAPAAAWTWPVRGDVARGFAYAATAPFAAGAHRGVDLPAAPGERVRAPCAGRVVSAGRVPGGAAVSVRCGPWRVSLLALGRLAVRRGDRVRAGAVVGRAAPGLGHAGVHVGVRREGRRWAYVDPLRFLRRPPAPPPVGPARPRVAPPSVPRAVPAVPRLRPHAGPRGRAVPESRLPPPLPAVPALRVRPLAPGAAPATGGLAPWPVWAGLGLALAGAAGGGVRVRRRRVARLARAAPAGVPR